jgi:hypothetical protein
MMGVLFTFFPPNALFVAKDCFWRLLGIQDALWVVWQPTSILGHSGGFLNAALFQWKPPEAS